MMYIGKIKNSLTILECPRILCIYSLANPRSPIRGLFQVLAVDGKQPASLQKYYIRFVGMDRSKCLLYQTIDIRLTGRGMVHTYDIHVFSS